MDRSAELAAARLAVAKKYGEGAVAPTEVQEELVETISSGAFLLDAALGIGGFPRGRLIELFGEPSSGKTTLANYTAVEVQKKGLPVLYMDYEMAFDPSYVEKAGVSFDPALWILAQPDSMEQGLSVAEHYIEKNLVGLVIFDSLAAMVPERVLAGEIGDTHVAVQARIMAQALMRLTHKIHDSQAIVVFINHVRSVIGTMPGRQPRKTTPGGSALKFYSSVRVEVQPVESIKGKIEDIATGRMIDAPVAVKVRALVVKNKLGPPYRQGSFYLQANVGISEQRSVLEVGEARGVLRRNGSRYVLPFRAADGEKNVNLAGVQATLDWLGENPDKYAKLKEAVLQRMRGEGQSEVVEPPETESGAKELAFEGDPDAFLV